MKVLQYSMGSLCKYILLYDSNVINDIKLTLEECTVCRFNGVFFVLFFFLQLIAFFS